MDTACDWKPSANLVESYLHHCPAREVLSVLADKWVLLVLGVLRESGDPVRFNDLRRRLDGITQKMLTKTLRGLERDGLVRRDVYPTVPPRVEYSLSELGASLGELSHAMGMWSEQHHTEILSAREDFDVRTARTPAPLR
jgi:DNA-binding HxlR family transcriptional regulator